LAGFFDGLISRDGWCRWPVGSRGGDDREEKDSSVTNGWGKSHREDSGVVLPDEILAVGYTVRL
jgi:hypothetical protein